MGFPHKFRCFGRAEIGARAKKTEGGGGEEKRKLLQSTLPFILSPSPLFLFALAPIFSRPKHRNLCGNPTETLATQANNDVIMVAVKYENRWKQVIRFFVSYKVILDLNFLLLSNQMTARCPAYLLFVKEATKKFPNI